MLLRGGEKSEIKNIYKRKTIYLAETGHDLSVQRNIIKRELQRHGYIVLPNQTLPGTASELEKMVRRDVEDSSLSIHLWQRIRWNSDGADRSIVDLQKNRYAAEKSQKVGKDQFSRLIWISPTLSNASERQKAFIDNIKRDVDAQEVQKSQNTPGGF